MTTMDPDEFSWSWSSALWQIEHGEPGPRTRSAAQYIVSSQPLVADLVDVIERLRAVANRTPDEIMTDIDDRKHLWEVIDDLRSSYRLAMESLVPPLDPDRVDEVQDTVLDYLVNNYGDD